jgi:WD40 repeat protein
MLARLKGSGGVNAEYSPDGTLILTAGHRDYRILKKGGEVVDRTWTGDVRLWDARTFRPLSSVVSLPNLDHAAFVAGGKYVLSIGRGELVLWEANLSKARVRVPLDNVVRAAAVDRDGACVAISAFPKEHAPHAWTLEIHDGATGNVVRALPQWDLTDYLAFSADGALLLATSPHPEHGHLVHVWNVRESREQFEPFRVDSELTPFFNLVPADFSPDGKRLVVLEAPLFKINDAQTGKELLSARGRDGKPWDGLGCLSVRFTADGKSVATLDTTTLLFDAATGLPLTDERGRIDRSASHLSADGCRVLGPTGVWDMRTGQEVRSFGTRCHSPLALSPDGKRAATGDPDNGDTLIWDVSE